MKTLKLKTLTVSVTLLIAAGVFFFTGESYAVSMNPYRVDFLLNFGQTEKTQSVSVSANKHYSVFLENADEQNMPNWLKVNDHYGQGYYWPDGTLDYYDYFFYIDDDSSPHVIDVEVHATALTPGEYSHTIPWKHQLMEYPYPRYNGPNLYVDLTVCGPPSLSVSKSSLNFGTSGSSLNLTVSNSQYGDQLNWWVGLKPSWVSLSPSSGSLGPPGGSQTVTATVNRGGLGPGTYTDTIIFTSNGGSQSVSVSMTVPEPVVPEPDPKLSVNPTTHDFETSEINYQFTVTNTGGGTLNWSVSEGILWLSLDKIQEVYPLGVQRM